MKRKGILIVVSGFSGAGKGTLMKRIVSAYDNYALSVSMTTRKPRPGEVEGTAYFFTGREQFEKKIEEGGFVEYAQYCGNYYGTPKAYVESKLEAGKDVILEIEIQGALKVKDEYPEALLLFVMPPSAKELESRLSGRGTETVEVIRSRLQRAVEESEGIENYEYLIINDDLDDCVREMNDIIQIARRSPARNRSLIKRMQGELKALVKGEDL